MISRAAAPSLKGRSLRWLAQREHSRAELARKLRGYAQSDEEAARIEPLLDELAAKGFLSDERTAESMLAGKGQRLGTRRLKQELQAKGLDAALISATLAKSRESELDRARALWQRKFGAEPVDAKEHAKQSRFLAGRGFSGDVIGRVLRGAESSD